MVSTTNNSEEVRLAIRRAPQVIRDIIGSDELSGKLLDLGKKHGLHINQVGILGDHLNMLMLGIETAEEFTRRISHEMEISSNAAQIITRDVNTAIFVPVRRALQGVGVEPENMGCGLGHDSSEPHPAREDVLRGIEEPETLPMKVREYPRAPSAAPIHATATPLETKPPTEAPAEKPAEIAPPHEHANLPAVEPDEHPMVVLAESHERAVPTPAPRPPVTPPITPASRASDPYREAIE